jgi:hypothetical protein
MVVVSGDAFGASIDIGKVYYFKSEKLTATNQPHYFIVIAVPTNQLVIFSCCTSQFEKRARFIELNNLPYSTLVRIKPDSSNELKKESYVDCNNYFEYSKHELIAMYAKGEIEFIGYVASSIIEEIRQGINDSPLIPAEIKAMIIP